MAAAELGNAMIAVPVAARDWLAVAPVAIPVLAAAVLMMVRHNVRWHPAIALAALAAVVAGNLLLLQRVVTAGPFSMTMGRWLPPFGISFTVDVLGAGLALVAAFVGLICGLAAPREIDATGRRYGFYPMLMLLMAGVGGAFLTGDIFNLYVWFEVFVIASFGLIILGSKKRQIDGALKYAVLNLIGTTLFLIATGYLYGVFGTLNMADIARKVPSHAGAPLATLSVLYLLAFGMKAAAFPVNFWLPASYHTPPMVTAALFGGVLTKVGIYALLRVLVMLLPMQRQTLQDLIGWVAVATMLFGVLGALSQADLRRILGFLVISGIGVMLAGLAIGGTAISGVALYIVHSMLVTTGLYLFASAVEQRGGSYSLHDLGGLWRAQPLLSAIALVLFLALTGLPPGSGLWPKVMLVRAAVENGHGGLAAAILASSMLMTIALGRVFLLAFWREAPVGLPQLHISRARGLGPIIVLTAAVLTLGVWPQPAIAIVDAAAAGLLDPASYLRAVFPGGAR